MVHAISGVTATPGTCHRPIKIERDVSSNSTHTGTECVWRFSPSISRHHHKPSPQTTRCTHPPYPCIDSTFYPPSPRSPFIPLSTSSYNCLPPSSSTPQINNTVENVHTPLLDPPQPPWAHPIPPTSTHTSLSPFLFLLPSSCWTSLHPYPPPQSVHLGAPSLRYCCLVATHLTSSSSSYWGWWSPSLGTQPFPFTNVWRLKRRLPEHIQETGSVREVGNTRLVMTQMYAIQF